METATLNVLEEGLAHLELVIGQRMNGLENGELTLPPLPANGIQTPLTTFVQQHQLSGEEYLILLMGLAPHIQPDFFDQVIQSHLDQAGDYPKLGGVRGKQYRGFLPTGETALFLLGGKALAARIKASRYFNEQHLFARNRIIWLEEPPDGEPRMSGKLIISQDYVDLFTLGSIPQPRFSMRFPGQLLETKMEWSDLVLSIKTLQQIRELLTWIKHGKTLLNDYGMRKRIKAGYRALFYGPPGTGKTLTASLLGKETGKDVYRVDLSMVVSKYIGETEKNLSNLFARAENKDWILFFDEADALFSKRTNVRDAHDKYANQEVSYLLQRVENYNGMVILASNFKTNIDDAFMRRFQSVVFFPQPNASERQKLWEQTFPENMDLGIDVNLVEIAKNYEITGGGIINVVQYACLQALNRNGTSKVILLDDIKKGIIQEFKKEGKI